MSPGAREEQESRAHPAPGAISALIEELASAPERDLESAWDPRLRPGERVGRFELVRELGRGGFGVVFEARDLELARNVAFKVLRPGALRRDCGHERLLAREAETIAQLQHPNIVTLHDVGRCEGGAYLILELLRGEPLSSRLDRGALPVREALRIAIEMTRALAYAHGQGVLHRDLKPGNVFLTNDGTVKVLDFGLAHVLGADRPVRSGTPGYMAPEQLRGDPEDARTDLYALGAVFFELFTGDPVDVDPVAQHTKAAPRIDRTAVPGALADLAERMLDPDPRQRPRDAVQVLRALTRIERSRSSRAGGVRRRFAILAATVVAASAALAGWWIGLVAGRARTIIAVADTQNATGEAELDEISGLLAKSLEQSRRLVLVPRARLLDAAGDRGRDRPARLDAGAAAEASRAAGADVLLSTSVRRAGALYLVDVRAEDLHDHRERFALRDTADAKARMPDVLDRLSERARRALSESDREVRSDDITLKDALTGSLEAYNDYFRGVQCAARPAYGQDCGAYFRRAIEKDPGFALAHYELAVWSNWYGGSRREQLESIRLAAANADRAPEKERLLIQAFSAYLSRRDDVALTRYAEVTRRWPQDGQAFFGEAQILIRRDEFAAAIPPLQRALALNPDLGWVRGELVRALGMAGRGDAIRGLVREWERAPDPAALHGLSLAYGWLGDLRGAARAAERGVSLGVGLPAQEDLLAARIFAGHYDEAVPGLEALAAPASEVRPIGYYALAAVDGYRGRWRSGLDRLDALGRDVPAMEGDALYRTLRVDYLLGGRDRGAVWRELEALRALDPRAAAEHAAGLAWLGDLAHAEILARDLSPGSLLARTYEAVAAWRRGDSGGLDRLRELARERPLTIWRVAPLYLYGELAVEAGRDAEAVDAFQRFDAMYLPLMLWRSWAHPRSLYLIARSQERLGRTGEAREAADRLLGQWEHAASDNPLATEARALRVRLGP